MKVEMDAGAGALIAAAVARREMVVAMLGVGQDAEEEEV